MSISNIEDEKLDQNKGSFKLGTLLKQTHVDNVIKKYSEKKKKKKHFAMEKT